MRRLVKYKIWGTLLLAPVIVGIGAYNFVTGNIQYAHAWFLWGLISIVAGVLWILISGRFRRHSNK